MILSFYHGLKQIVIIIGTMKITRGILIEYNIGIDKKSTSLISLLTGKASIHLHHCYYITLWRYYLDVHSCVTKT